MSRPVQGKTAIVTGAGSGINYCFVKLLLENGCNCVIGDQKLRREAQALVKQYSSSTPRALFQPTNVADWKQLENLFDVAEREFGGIDIVCPGAGIYEPRFSNFWYPPGSAESDDSPFDSRYATLDININHPIRTTQLAISRFVNAKTPKSIIHISSIAGQIASLSTPLYVATKYALSGFVRSLAKLERLGIRVTAVAPGFIKTPLWTEDPDKMAMVDESKDEWVTPEEVATVMLAMVQQDQISESILGTPKENENMISVQGGTILEVSKSVRKVSMFNDPGPLGRPGNSMSDAREVEEEIFERVQSVGWGKVERN